VMIDADLQVCKLSIEPSGCLRCGLNLRFGILLLIGADERIDDRSRQCGVAGSESNLNQECVRHGFHMQTRREVLEKPGLRLRGGLVGIETGKTLGKAAPKALLLVE